MQGVFNVIIPSYSADLSGLSEEAIRHDVRLQEPKGFSGYLAVSETALTLDEYIAFVRIGAHEAQGTQLVIHHASFNTLEENIVAAQRAAGAGAQLVLLSYPPNFYPRGEDEIYRYTRAFCDQVDLAVMLFPVPLWGFERIHPACLSIDLIERLVDDVANVVAVKAEGGHPSIAGFTEVWNRLHERVVVTMPLEHQAIPLATLVPMRCIATSNTEYFGDAVPRMLALVRSGKDDEAMRLFWQVDPARRANASIASIGGANMVHRMAWKYQAWLNGYNGGPLRMPTARLLFDQMRLLRSGLERSELEVTDNPDEEYWMGRVAVGTEN
jgi:4-hydroxy-tetrahydrodipicolinate synthase